MIVDTSTGVSADLFSGFEAAQVPPATPAISADGKTVVTGRPNVTNGNFHHLITSTDVSSFPSTTTGPFPHQTIDPGSNGVGTGQTLELALGPNGLVAYEVRVPELTPGLGVTTLGGSGPECGLDDGDAELSQPAFAASSTDYMLYTRRSLPGAVHPGDIWFAPLNRTATAGSLAAPSCPRSSTRPLRMNRDRPSPRTAAMSGLSAISPTATDIRCCSFGTASPRRS